MTGSVLSRKVDVPWLVDASSEALDPWEGCWSLPKREIVALGVHDWERLAIYRVRSDEMRPFANVDDVVFVERDDKAYGVGVVTFGGILGVRRIQHLSGNRVRLSCDNSHYPGEVIVGSDDDYVRVVGRIVAVWRTARSQGVLAEANAPGAVGPASEEG